MCFRLLCVAAVVSVAVPASAQSTYVAAGVGADFVRMGGVEARGVEESRGGEAFAWSLRLGVGMTDAWGVEFGSDFSSEIEHEIRGGFPLPLLGRQVVSGIAVPPGTTLPIFESTLRVSRSLGTLDAIAWLAQPVGSRARLIYLGGVAFTRTVEDTDFSFTRQGAVVLPMIAPSSTRTTTYGAGPVVGLEARLDLTTRAFLIPGIRLQGIGGGTGGGWLVRPAVALGWRF
jgi:hypothetical protein